PHICLLLFSNPSLGDGESSCGKRCWGCHSRSYASSAEAAAAKAQGKCLGIEPIPVEREPCAGFARGGLVLRSLHDWGVTLLEDGVSTWYCLGTKACREESIDGRLVRFQNVLDSKVLDLCIEACIKSRPRH
ncbi:unnamed protein product, partial [Phaeothamnion confervicola]